MLRTSTCLVLFAFAASTFPGCAEGGGNGGGGDGGSDGSMPDAPRDAAARDTGVPDAAMLTCAAGSHVCGTACMLDQPNVPASGCRSGCGTACAAPASGTATCTMAGACDFTCEAPFRRDGAACVCPAVTCMDIGYMCGTPDNGCGTPLSCGTCATGTCMMGRCACSPDPHEPNDGNTLATRGPELNDADNPDLNLADYSIDEARDVDWMVFHIVDGTDGGNPVINIRLSGIPAGSDYDLAGFYVCDAGSEATGCNQGTIDNTLLGNGCIGSHTSGDEIVELATDCSHISTDDSGSLYIRVTAPTYGGSCAPYQIAMTVR